MAKDEISNKIIAQISDGKIRHRRYGSAANCDLTKQEWEKVLLESKGYCTYCGKYIGIEKLTIEHVVPLAKGGDHSIDNVIPCCHKCNITQPKYKRINKMKVYKNHTAVNLSDEQMADLQLIQEYLANEFPGMDFGMSAAIRYAIGKVATDIKVNFVKKVEGDPDLKFVIKNLNKLNDEDAEMIIKEIKKSTTEENRNDQVNWIRQTASDIASYQSVTLDDYNGDKNWMARDIVNYYLEHAEELPGWMDEHDKNLLIEFTEKSI